jgi:hypothetical protein
MQISYNEETQSSERERGEREREGREGERRGRDRQAEHRRIYTDHKDDFCFARYVQVHPPRSRDVSIPDTASTGIRTVKITK